MNVRQIQLRLFSELRSTAMTSKRKSSVEQFEPSSSENKKQRPQQSVQLVLLFFDHHSFQFVAFVRRSSTEISR